MHVFNRSAIALHPPHASVLECTSSIGCKPLPDSVASLLFNASRYCMSRLVDVRNDAVRHKLAIPIPILPILSPTLLVVSPLPMNKQYRKIQHKKVGKDHAPSLRLAWNNILLVTALEEHSVFDRS